MHSCYGRCTFYDAKNSPKDKKGIRRCGMMAERYINAYDFAETIENLDITVAGKPARWNDAKYTVLKEIAEAPDADVAPRAEVAREVIKEIEDAINKRYDQHVFSCDLEDTEAEAVMDFHTDLYFDIEKIKEKYGITDADGKE
jgi:hypothetical protein